MLEMFGSARHNRGRVPGHARQADGRSGRVAAHVGLSAEAARAELTVLAELMLVNAGPGGGPYFAIPPEQALEVLLAAEEARISECRRRAGKGGGGGGGGSSRPSSPAGACATRAGSSSRSTTLRSSRPGCSSWLHSGGRTRSPSFFRGRMPLRRWALSPGSTTSCSVEASRYERSSRTRPWRSPDTGATTSPVRPGAGCRSVPSGTPTRLVIVDETAQSCRRAQAPAALVMKDPDLVAPITALLLDAVWHASAPVLAERNPAEGDEFSDARVRQVVALLAQGQKDEAIARRLQISVRTVRRLVSASLTALHAESRFEAGVIAVRRGWVS